MPSSSIPSSISILLFFSSTLVGLTRTTAVSFYCLISYSSSSLSSSLLLFWLIVFLCPGLISCLSPTISLTFRLTFEPLLASICLSSLLLAKNISLLESFLEQRQCPGDGTCIVAGSCEAELGGALMLLLLVSLPSRPS